MFLGSCTYFKRSAQLKKMEKRSTLLYILVGRASLDICPQTVNQRLCVFVKTGSPKLHICFETCYHRYVGYLEPYGRWCYVALTVVHCVVCIDFYNSFVMLRVWCTACSTVMLSVRCGVCSTVSLWVRYTVCCTNFTVLLLSIQQWRVVRQLEQWRQNCDICIV